MKIGILGGTFNPPHVGHLILAWQVQQKLGLDKIFFIPNNIAVHKEKTEVSAGHRLVMIRIAIKDNPNFKVLDLEIKRSGVSYTIDTIKELKEIYPNHKFYLIIGSDLAKDFSTWKNYKELKKQVEIVVVQRKGVPFSGFEEFIPVKITEIDLSSSKIRNLIKDDISIKYLVPESVMAYINENNLYK